MTFKFTDNYHSKPIREDINKKIEQAESEGFSGINQFVKLEEYIRLNPRYIELINKRQALRKQVPPQPKYMKSGQKELMPEDLRNKLNLVKSQIDVLINKLRRKRR